MLITFFVVHQGTLNFYKTNIISKGKMDKDQKKVSAAKKVKGSVEVPLWEKVIKKKRVYILGTAHISAQSVKDVHNLIKEKKPDVVCVELCPSRYKAMLDPQRWKKLDIVQIIRERKLYLLMSSLFLSIFQKKMGENTKIKPGMEIKTAIEIARKKKIPLELVDRDIQITLKRAWQGIGYFRKMTLISEILAGLFFSVQIEPEEIEKMKQKDILEDMFQNLPPRYGFIKKILVEERDRYLAQKINDTVKKYPKAKRIAVVIGAGHLAGIKKFISEKQDLAGLEKIKPASKMKGIIKFFAPILTIMGLFYYFSDSGDPQKIWENLKAWVVIKAFCSGIITLLLLAHPLAILGAIVTAPISNFNPVLKPGWVAALIEAKYHRPRVSDFERLTEDSNSIKGYFQNKVFRIFNVFIFPQLGSSIGTGLALWYMSR